MTEEEIERMHVSMRREAAETLQSRIGMIEQNLITLRQRDATHDRRERELHRQMDLIYEEKPGLSSPKEHYLDVVTSTPEKELYEMGASDPTVQRLVKLATDIKSNQLLREQTQAWFYYYWGTLQRTASAVNVWRFDQKKGEERLKELETERVQQERELAEAVARAEVELHTEHQEFETNRRKQAAKLQGGAEVKSVNLHAPHVQVTTAEASILEYLSDVL